MIKPNFSIIQNLRNALATKTSYNVWGDGFTFQSDDEKVMKAFKKIDKQNELISLFGYMERYLSNYGRCILTMNKNKKGDLYLNIPSPFYFQGVGKVFHTPTLAVVWQKVVIDTQNLILKTTYTLNETRNDLLYPWDKDQGIRVFDQQERLGDLGLDPVWKHNLGFLTLIEITNKPIRQFNWNNEEFTELADWYPAQQWEQVIVDAHINLRKEMYFCHSRILIENAPQELIDKLDKSKQNETQEFNGDIDFGDYILQTEVGGDFKPVPGPGDFTKYTTLINELMDLYMKFANSSRFSEGGGAQKTVAETSTVRSSLIETTTSKITFRTPKIVELIKKCLAWYGAIDYESDEELFTFKINGNIVKDESVFIDNLIKKLEIGAISMIDVIQELFGIDKATAEEKFTSIKDFNEENDITTNLTGFANEEGDQAAITSTGDHPNQKDKQGAA